MRLAVLTLIFAVCPAWGQIAQSHAEYCGIPGGINSPLPPDISATIDQNDGEAVLYIGRGTSARKIPLMIGTLPSLISEIAEVCPLRDGRLVVLGDFGGTDVFIIDTKSASLVDSFPAYLPVLSPDQRWIVYRKFYPLHGVEASDELLIYDLSKSPAQNRPAGTGGVADVGRLLFPPGQDDLPFDNIGVPSDQMHFTGRHLYWSADSRAILFEDHAASGPGIVLIALDEKGTPAAFRHALTTAEMCGRDIQNAATQTWRLERAEIGSDLSGNRATFLDIGSSGDNRCAPHTLQLHREDFLPARREVHAEPEYAHGAIVDGKELIPPKKKK
jgi:hypothetical protein